MKRAARRLKYFFLVMAVLLIMPAEGGAAEGRDSPTSKPHIIFVMADDMGWGQTGYRGHPVLETPHLDAMAAAGLGFERFYAGAPVCSPTRASVLTGRANDRTGVLQHGYALRLQEKTVAQALKGGAT
jgi:arylsulfatase A-like enzyme